MIPIADLIKAHPGLVNELARYDYVSVAPLIGGFLTLPNFHANTLRLDALAHIASFACDGKRQADREMLVRCAGRHFADSFLINYEDPVEDVFIGNVATRFGNFRVFRGIEESGMFWLEQLLRLFEEPNFPEPLKPIIKHVGALLALSEAVAERLQLKRFTFGSGRLGARLEIPRWRELSAAANAVTFSRSDLTRLEITPECLTPFILSRENRKCLLNQSPGHSDFERFPLAQFGDNIIIAAPHAITASIRRFVIERLKQSGFLGFLDIFLHQRQFERWIFTLKHDFQFQPINLRLPDPAGDLPIRCQAVMSFDDGKYAHLILLDGNTSGYSTLGSGIDAFTEKQQQAFEKHLRECAEILRKLPHFNGGMSVVTRGGVGNGVKCEFPIYPDDWYTLFASIPDWNTLAECKDMSALRLWRMSRHQRWAEARGLEIRNCNGLLNLFACWEKNNWHFFLRKMPLNNAHQMLTPEIDFLTSVRKEVAESHDVHSCLSHGGVEWVRVQRLHPRGSYSMGKTTPMYIAPESMSDGELIGSIETKERIWWVKSKTHGINIEGRSIVYQLWECMLQWMDRAVPVIEKEMGKLPSQSVCIEINVSDPSQWRDCESEQLQQRAKAQLKLDVVSVERTISITIPAEFRNEFYVPENRAEQTMVNCVLTGVAEIAGNALAESHRKQLLSEILPNKEARFFHVVRVENLALMLGENMRPSPDFIPEEDCVQSMIGLAQELGDIPKNNVVLGEKECIRYLERAADKQWERIEQSLSVFDRKELIKHCFSDMAELEKDGEHWNMTASAILAFHEDETEVLRVAEERSRKRDAASLANRLLIETSMYACPAVGGRPFPRAEHSEILALMINLLSISSHRDAISGGFMPAEIHIYPNGELDIDDCFYESIVIPYIRAVHAKEFRASAKAYEQYFSNCITAEVPNAELIISRMEQPFFDEFGLTFNEFVQYSENLRQHAIQAGNPLFELTEQEFIGVLKTKSQINNKSVNAYMTLFSLTPRQSWNKDLPNGCKESDVHPWRFRRRLSLLMRPFVLLCGKPDKRWLVYVPIVMRSAAYLINNLSEAAFPSEYFHSETMLKFHGDQANRRGNQFNREVSERLEELGYFTLSEVYMSKLGVPTSAGDYGDVDVLAWRNSSPDVFVIECKKLRMALSVRDVIDRLEEYRGEVGDSLAKHVRRLNWLKSNPAEVSALTGISTAIIRLNGLLVTSDIVPMQFFDGATISPKDVVDFDQLEEKLI